MNKNVVGIVLIVLAIVIGYIYAWPKMQPYFSSPPPPKPGDQVTTMPMML
jgi:hypothetical protein